MSETTLVEVHPDRPLLPKEAAAHLRCSVPKLRDFEKDPKNPLPVHRIGHGSKAQRRFYRSELDAWLRSRCFDEREPRSPE